MLTVKRPGLGIPPYLRDQVVGRRARRAVAADEWISWDAL
jgi:N-acetylneuraminate synthase/N,N'-diacetyllegionaminate synthase